MAIILQDSNNAFWSVSADATGHLTATPGANGPAATIFLRDSSGNLWLLGIFPSGLLTTTASAPSSSPQFNSINLGTVPNFVLTVNTLGLLQTTPFPIWQPNGAGAGTDNKIVGGGGGYIAIPQPPTGPNAGFRPVENNGQFGSLQQVFWNGIGNYFTVSNPGRSTNQ